MVSLWHTHTHTHTHTHMLHTITIIKIYLSCETFKTPPNDHTNQSVVLFISSFKNTCYIHTYMMYIAHVRTSMCVYIAHVHTRRTDKLTTGTINFSPSLSATALLSLLTTPEMIQAPLPAIKFFT